MKKIDNALLASFRARTHCEVCLAWVSPLEPHHILSRGMGGSSRMDIAENIIALCSNCHRLVHSGHVKRDILVKIVALRQGVTPDVIWERLWEMRRRRK